MEIATPSRKLGRCTAELSTAAYAAFAGFPFTWLLFSAVRVSSGALRMLFYLQAAVMGTATLLLLGSLGWAWIFRYW